MRRDRPKATTAVHGPSGHKFLSLEKAKVTTDCLENQFSPHDLCDENHERQVVARIQALSEAVADSATETVRPCDVQKTNKLSNHKRPIELMAFQTNALRRLPRKLMFHLAHLFNHCLWLSHFPSS